ncbi:MAG: cobaltochelatase subunit CobN [Burkholderiaceae bacterium]
MDVVLSATGLYPDHFPNLMQHLARAVELAAAAEEPDNAVAINSRAITARLQGQGLAAEAARRAGVTRIFASASGNYGTGLDDAALASDTWEGKGEGDRKLAELYLQKMQYAYGPDNSEWGRSDLGGDGVNLYAEQLRGTEGAVLSRSSNLYGMLTTDDPFQYLGGIALAVRYLDGRAPALSISNLRGGGSGRVEGAAGFLAKELATRQFHPGYIENLMAEGYAGTIEIADAMNNFWGWTAVSREIVRDDQWQEFVDVYVRDKHELGVREWFERENPAALAQVMERMLEAARQEYWQADAATVEELKQRYADLLERFDLQTGNAALAEFVGYGLAAAPQPERPPAPMQRVEGQQLQRVDPAAVTGPDWLRLLLPLAVLALIGLGVVQRRFASGVSTRFARPRATFRLDFSST